MSEPYLTIAEIEAKYPNEWVLLDKLKTRRDGTALGGVVVAHSAEREPVYRACEQLPPPRDVALFHTGPIPEDVVFLL
jgi:hypothetical protein